MDEDRISGAETNIGGKIKDAVGSLTGNDRMRAEGKADQFSGRVQNAFGSAKDTVSDGAQAAGSWLDSSLREYPVLGFLAGVGLGFILARIVSE